MSMFTLAISCYTTSKLPWCVDLTFQVPMQYCSLQHRTLLPLPVTSTAGWCCCCCFALAPSLHSFWSCVSTDLQEHIGHLPTWGVHLSVSYLFTFSFCSWDSQGKSTEVVCLPFSIGPYFVRILHHDPTVLGVPPIIHQVKPGIFSSGGHSVPQGSKGGQVPIHEFFSSLSLRHICYCPIGQSK